MPDESLHSLRSENERLSSENEELRLRLDEAEQTLEAIRTGEAESLIVEGPDGPRIFSLEGTDYSYRVLVEAMSEGAATISEDGTILFCNRRFAELLSAPLERLMGSAIQRFLPDHARDGFEAMVREANEGESRGEMELLGAGDQALPVFLSMSVIRDADRPRLCLVATDLRSQKRSEEVVAAERLARAVLEQAAEAIVVCDEQGRVIRVNGAARELSGSNALLASVDVGFPLVLDSSRPLAPETRVASRALRGEVLSSAPAWLLRSDGSKCHLIVSAAPLISDGDRIIGCVVTMTDISALKQKEEDLLGANLQLADADRRKDEYLAMLAHELRNPLAAIKSSLYIVDRAPPGGNQAKQALAVMERQIAQLERFVDDLLDVTRISHKKIQLKLERFDLNEVVKRTIEDYRPLFGKSGVRLDATFAPEPVIVSADWARIAQVVGNLLTNAAKFTESGGSTQVSVARDAKESQATIRVVDTGAGLAPELLPRLFEPFTQADRTLDRSKGGLGLGLALVKGLVEGHGGEVTAHSAGPGEGAAFSVCLPFDVAATEPEPFEPEPPHPEPPAATRRTRILVIDDDADAADSLRGVLELDDHEVEVAYDGPEGLEKARRFKPDIVFSDIGLPGMNGYEVARAFRSDETLKDVHLVALSGYGMPEDLERAASAGFERHLLKPASLKKIEAVVSEMSRSSMTDS